MLRAVLIALSQQKKLRAFAERSAVGHKLSDRFVAGMTVDEAVAACERVNCEDMAVSLDSLGESVTAEAEARASAEVYHRLLDAIAVRGLRANVSLKLSQMGLEFDAALAERIVGEIVEHAAGDGGFVRLDMEGTPHTEATISMTERLHERWPGHVGTVLQAYLYRTEADTERLLGQGIRIRLCKGAYKEDETHAFPAKADVDANYLRLMRRMATSEVFCGIATHDEAIITAMQALVRDGRVTKSAFEFQMLYGVRKDLQRRLVKEGYGVRVYIPFGTAWYPYFMRRLAERPANVLFLARNFFRG